MLLFRSSERPADPNREIQLQQRPSVTTRCDVLTCNLPQNPAQNSPISCDSVQLLDSGGAGFPQGPLRVPRPANAVATGTLMDQAPFPNTYRLEVDGDKIDPNGVLAIRVSFHSSKVVNLDPQLIEVSTGEGKLRWNLLSEYVGQQATQKDIGQVTFRVQAGNREAPINTIDVKVGGTREPGLLDLNNRNFRSVEYQTCRVRLYKVN